MAHMVTFNLYGIFSQSLCKATSPIVDIVGGFSCISHGGDSDLNATALQDYATTKVLPVQVIIYYLIECTANHVKGCFLIMADFL